MATEHPTIIRRQQVEARTGLSRSAIYARLRRNPKRPHDYDPTFPRPVQIGPRAVGWIASEVDAWIEARTARRDAATPGAPDSELAGTGRRTAPRRRPLARPAAVPILDGEA
jgi:prophage regulatory protein